MMFGFNPEGKEVAWGARAIVTNGKLDIPHDRQQFIGSGPDKNTLREHLVSVVRDAPMVNAERVLHDGLDLPADPESVLLYEDEKVEVRGRFAGGYCYLGAWLHDEEEPEDDPVEVTYTVTLSLPNGDNGVPDDTEVRNALNAAFKDAEVYVDRAS